MLFTKIVHKTSIKIMHNNNSRYFDIEQATFILVTMLFMARYCKNKRNFTEPSAGV